MCTILAIESSCDDTSAAIIQDGRILSNVVSSQIIHQKYGGVVPELASRAHQGSIVPVVNAAFSEANIRKSQLNAIAFTQGPGLLGSLLVGNSFAKAMALGLNIPLIAVDHLQAHMAAHFIDAPQLQLPMLCLLVSGGHTLLVQMDANLAFTFLGRSTDDAAGEAFDKAAKILDLPYPGGPLIDQYAQNGNPYRFNFPEPQISGLDMSFSGLKTAFLYFIRDHVAINPNFIQENMADICASYQHRIVIYLLQRLKKASKLSQIKTIGLAGGVAANSYLRKKLMETAQELNWELHIPSFQYCTDNAAMVAMAAHFKYLKADFAGQDCTPFTRSSL